MDGFTRQRRDMLLRWPGLNASALVAYEELLHQLGDGVALPAMAGVNYELFGRSIGGSKSAAKRWLDCLASCGLVERTAGRCGRNGGTLWRVLDVLAIAARRGLRVQPGDDQALLFDVAGDLAAPPAVALVDHPANVPEPARNRNRNVPEPAPDRNRHELEPDAETAELQRQLAIARARHGVGTQVANIRHLDISKRLNINIGAGAFDAAGGGASDRPTGGAAELAELLAGDMYAAGVAGVFQWCVHLAALMVATDAVQIGGHVVRLSQAAVDGITRSCRSKQKGGRYWMGALKHQVAEATGLDADNLDFPSPGQVADWCDDVGWRVDRSTHLFPYERLVERQRRGTG